MTTLPGFIGQLPQSLLRDPYTGEPALKHRYRTAREFVLACADFMRLRGRDVTVTESDGGVMVFSPGPFFGASSVSAGAVRVSRRWRFLGANDISRGVKAKDYPAAKILVEVYGR